MGDADSVLEVSEFASAFPENAGSPFPRLCYPVPVFSHTVAMGMLFAHEYSLVPLVVCRFPRVGWTRVKTRLRMILEWWC